MVFEFSKHALEQMQARGITRSVVKKVLDKPDKIKNEKGKKVYQSVIEKGTYLIRIFVNVNKVPPLVITVYKTSKIKKYHES